jgi:hypothetical protein
LDAILLLPSEEFIKAIQSPGPSTNLDSIKQLSTEARSEIINQSGRRPLRTEVDTFVVNSLKKFNENAPIQAFVDNLNLIKLVKFIPAPDSPDEVAHFCEVLNKEMKFVWTHEKDHSDASKYDLSRLNLDQISVFMLNLEISARLKELLLRRKVLMDSKRITDAFPRDLYDIDSRRKQDLDFEGLWLDTNAKNPFVHHSIRLRNVENKDYLKWLFDNRFKIGDSPSREEMDVIFAQVLKNANKEYDGYFQNGQFSQMVGNGLVRQFHQIRIKYREFKKGNGIDSKEFDALIQGLYGDALAIISDNTSFVYKVIVQQLYENQANMRTIAELTKARKDVLGHIAAMQAEMFGTGGAAQKYDVSDSRTKRFSLNETDVEKIKKIMNWER